MPKLVTPVLQTNPPEPTAAACGSPHRRGAAPSRWCRSPMVRSANAPTRPIAIDQLCLNDKRACRRSASQLTLAMHAPTHCPKCAVLRGDGRRAGSERPASNRVGVEKAPTSGGSAAMGPPNPSLARAGRPPYSRRWECGQGSPLLLLCASVCFRVPSLSRARAFPLFSAGGAYCRASAAAGVRAYRRALCVLVTELGIWLPSAAALLLSRSVLVLVAGEGFEPSTSGL